MKKKVLSSILGLSAFALILLVNPQKAEAVECKLVSISADRGSAIYDCGGRQITVLRGVVVR